MADEKKITAEQQLEDEKMNDEELDGVAGGHLSFNQSFSEPKSLKTTKKSSDWSDNPAIGAL